MSIAPRLLFVPVSGTYGMGEYARSLAIARAVAHRWPQAQIRFVLSQQAPYAAGTPFPTVLLPSSPTHHTPEMMEIIREFRPGLVVFDNAGRTAQLREAVRQGARIIFVSSRSRQRRKAFRLRWMRMIDEHWIAYPEFMAGALTSIESFKLKLLSRPTVRYLEAVLPDLSPEALESVPRTFGLSAGEYVVVIPGGGTGHPDFHGSLDTIEAAARRIAAHGHPVLLVGSTASPFSFENTALRVTPRVPKEDLCALVRGARLVVCNGGDTLLQALAYRRPCVAIPMAGDQQRRIARSARAGLVVAARLDEHDIEAAVASLLEDDARRSDLEDRISRRSLTNAMDAALGAIARLAGLESGEPPASKPPQ